MRLPVDIKKKKIPLIINFNTKGMKSVDHVWEFLESVSDSVSISQGEVVIDNTGCNDDNTVDFFITVSGVDSDNCKNVVHEIIERIISDDKKANNVIDSYNHISLFSLKKKCEEYYNFCISKLSGSLDERHLDTAFHALDIEALDFVEKESINRFVIDYTQMKKIYFILKTL